MVLRTERPRRGHHLRRRRFWWSVVQCHPLYLGLRFSLCELHSHWNHRIRLPLHFECYARQRRSAMDTPHLGHWIHSHHRRRIARHPPSFACTEIHWWSGTTPFHPPTTRSDPEPLVLERCELPLLVSLPVVALTICIVLHDPPSGTFVLPCVAIYHLIHHCVVHTIHRHRRHLHLQLLRRRRSDYSRTPERPLPVPMGDVPERDREWRCRIPPLGSRVLSDAAILFRRHLRRPGE